MQNVLPQEAERRQAFYGEKSLLVPSAVGWGWFFTHGSVPWVLLGALWGWGMHFLSTEMASWSHHPTHSSSWPHCSIVQVQWKWYMEEGTWGRFVLVVPQVKPLLRQSCLHAVCRASLQPGAPYSKTRDTCRLELRPRKISVSRCKTSGPASPLDVCSCAPTACSYTETCCVCTNTWLCSTPLQHT